MYLLSWVAKVCTETHKLLLFLCIGIITTLSWEPQEGRLLVAWKNRKKQIANSSKCSILIYEVYPSITVSGIKVKFRGIKMKEATQKWKAISKFDIWKLYRSSKWQLQITFWTAFPSSYSTPEHPTSIDAAGISSLSPIGFHGILPAHTPALPPTRDWTQSLCMVGKHCAISPVLHSMLLVILLIDLGFVHWIYEYLITPLMLTIVRNCS